MKKTFNIVFIASLVFTIAILLSPKTPGSPLPQKKHKSVYDSATLARKFLNGNDLLDYSANDLYNSIPGKKFYILYKNAIIDSLNYVFGNGATKIPKMYKEVLSISICSNSGCDASLYVKGIEIRKLFPDIKEKYFRVRLVEDNEIILCFENPDPKDPTGKTLIVSYGILNLVTMEFHRQQ